METSPERLSSQPASLYERIRSLPEDEILLILSSNTVTEVEMREMGDYMMQTLQSSKGTEYIFRTAVKEPIVRETYPVSYDMPDQESPRWPAMQVTADYYDAAVELRSEQMSHRAERLVCDRCKGGGQLTSSCGCTYGGVVLSDEESHDTTTLRPIGEADRNCVHCEGSGQKTSDCFACQGAGSIRLYPSLTVINEATGDSVTEVIDVGRLISDGWMPLERLHSREQGVAIDWRPLLTSLSERVGVVARRAIGVGLGESYRIETAVSDGHLFFRHHRLDPAQDKFAILRQLQQKIAVDFARESPLVSLDEQRRPAGRTLRITERGEPNVQLKELAQRLEYYGLKLGYYRGFIATGETGPTFVVVNEKGEVSGPALSADRSFAVALQSATDAASRLYPA